MSAMHSPPSPTPANKQRGIALFIVMIFVMLSMLLALWASRSSIFNEMVVGNDADYQRAFEAAQAMLQDAELDIRGEKSNGKPCTSIQCRKNRPNPSGDILKFPTSVAEREKLLDKLESAPQRCLQGLCARLTTWSQSDIDSRMGKNIGARYGEYTGAERTGHNNPLLNWINFSDVDKGSINIENTPAWYWIEILPYVDEKPAGLIVEQGSEEWMPILGKDRTAYRVTAIAHGRKPNTQVILQQVYIRRYHSGGNPL